MTSMVLDTTGACQPPLTPFRPWHSAGPRRLVLHLRGEARAASESCRSHSYGVAPTPRPPRRTSPTWCCQCTGPARRRRAARAPPRHRLGPTLKRGKYLSSPALALPIGRRPQFSGLCLAWHRLPAILDGQPVPFFGSRCEINPSPKRGETGWQKWGSGMCLVPLLTTNDDALECRELTWRRPTCDDGCEKRLSELESAWKPLWWLSSTRKTAGLTSIRCSDCQVELVLVTSGGSGRRGSPRTAMRGWRRPGPGPTSASTPQSTSPKTSVAAT